MRSRYLGEWEAEVRAALREVHSVLAIGNSQWEGAARCLLSSHHLELKVGSWVQCGLCFNQVRTTKQEGPRVLRVRERLLAVTEHGLDAGKESVGAARRWNEGPRRQEGGRGQMMRCLKVKDLRGWRSVRGCDRKLRAKPLGNQVGSGVGRSPE